MNNEQIALPAEIEAAINKRFEFTARVTAGQKPKNLMDAYRDGFKRGLPEGARIALSHTTSAQSDQDLVERMRREMLNAMGEIRPDEVDDIMWDELNIAAQACAKVAEQRINAIKAEYEQQISNLLAQARETQFGRFEP